MLKENDLTNLYDIIYKVVREDLKSLGYSEEFEDYFVNDIIDYILQDDINRIKRFYNRLFGTEDNKLLKSLFR